MNFSTLFHLQASRVLFGQNERFEDMVSTTHPEKFTNLDQMDNPDWALVRLLPLERSVLPPPLVLAPPEAVADGMTGVWLAGYPWGTCLKLSSPPNDAGFIRTIVTESEGSMAGPDAKQYRSVAATKGYLLENVFRHNLRASGGNSGSPILFNSGGKARVIGIHSNHMSEGGLRGKLFDFDYKDSPQVQPYFATEEFKYLHNATKTGLWSSMIYPNSHFMINFQLNSTIWPKPPAPPQGTVTITCEGRGFSKVLRTMKVTREISQSDIPVPTEFLACDVERFIVTYQQPPPTNDNLVQPETSSNPVAVATQSSDPNESGPSDSTSKSRRGRGKPAADEKPVETSLIFFKVACQLGKDFTNWTAMYEGANIELTPDPNPQNAGVRVAKIELSNWISKNWKNHWIFGQGSYDTTNWTSQTTSGSGGSANVSIAGSRLDPSVNNNSLTTNSNTTTTTSSSSSTNNNNNSINNNDNNNSSSSNSNASSAKPPPASK